MYNESNSKSIFPNSLKMADVTPIFKKDDRTRKDNYRPISVLPPVSKIFEKYMFRQIFSYIDKFLSPHLCGSRKGFNTQHSLALMIDRWQRALDKGKIAGALLTDLSKAFDCLWHDLLIAKLHAYGFDYNSLKLILSYLSDRFQRVRINGHFSKWLKIIFGVPQGSILGPPLFNFYLNDLFFSSF